MISQESPAVEKMEEKSSVEFRLTVPDLSTSERIQDGRHARAKTHISKGCPGVGRMEDERLTLTSGQAVECWCVYALTFD